MHKLNSTWSSLFPSMDEYVSEVNKDKTSGIQKISFKK